MRSATYVIVGLLSLALAFAMLPEPPKISSIADMEAKRERNVWQRPSDQTYLTFPEWYLVHSPTEFAEFIALRPADEFPFIEHIRLFWDSYDKVSKASADEELNVGYHAMILVIGLSTSIEYGIRFAYEKSVGRFARWLSGTFSRTELSAEDHLAADIASDYVQFIRKRPFYEFNFLLGLKKLWRLPIFGDGFVRKVERRYALTAEYGFKAAYAKLIGGGTAATYDAAIPRTGVLVDRNPCEVSKTLCGDGGVILSDPLKTEDGWKIEIPRYFAFRQAALQLADAGVEFVDIAGNRSRILLSYRRVEAVDKLGVFGARQLFVHPIPTDGQNRKRFAIDLPISKLSVALRERPLADSVEHIYDF